MPKCSPGALVVEFCRMLSRPVQVSLRIAPDTPVAQALRNALIDRAVSLPSYRVIFTVFHGQITRCRCRASECATLFPLAQAQGDRSAFIVADPAMQVFVPRVMPNDRVIVGVPCLRVRESPATRRVDGPLHFALPLMPIPAARRPTGAAFTLVGRTFGCV